MTEESSSCPMLFSTVRISWEKLSLLLPIIFLGGVLRTNMQANPMGKGYLVVSKPTYFQYTKPTSFNTQRLDSPQNSPTYAHSDLAYGFCSLKKNFWFWLVWLSGLSTSLQTEGSPVLFPIGAHAWVAGQVPSWGCVRGNQLMFLSHTDVSLPLFLPPFPSLWKEN